MAASVTSNTKLPLPQGPRPQRRNHAAKPQSVIPEATPPLPAIRLAHPGPSLPPKRIRPLSPSESKNTPPLPSELSPEALAQLETMLEPGATKT
jgi:hypothetical protein